MTTPSERTHAVRHDRLVLADGCLGLLSEEARDLLDFVLRVNFGP